MNSDLIRTRLREAEGVKLKPYLDTVGKWTVGVGRNLTDNGLRLVEVEFMLTNDITEAWVLLTKTWPWVLALSDVRQRALVEMVFQLGIGGVGAFKKALAAMEAGDFDTAAMEMLNSHWAAQTPSRAERLAAMVRLDQDV